MPNWKWYAGQYEETMSSGPFDSRDEALEIAREEYEGAWILEAYKEDVPLSKFFDVECFLETADDNAFDYQGENSDPLFELSKDQTKSLDLAIKTAIDQWQIDNNVKFTPWVFTGSRNQEYIEGEEEDGK